MRAILTTLNNNNNNNKTGKVGANSAKCENENVRVYPSWHNAIVQESGFLPPNLPSFLQRLIDKTLQCTH